MKKFTEHAVTIRNPRFTAAVLENRDAGAVFVRIAVPAGNWFAKPGKEPIAGVAASLLDEGTETLSREVFRAALESDGSRVSFWNDGRNVYVSIDATPSGLPAALSLAFDALAHPLIAEESVRQIIERQSEEYIHDSEDTDVQAESAMLRTLYKPGTPLHIEDPLTYRASLLTLNREEVAAFMRDAYRGPVTVAAMGNIEARELEKLLTAATASWNPEPLLSERKIERETAPRAGETYIPVPGKESLDVYLGGALPLSALDEDISAVRVAIDLLGGGFSDHLMQTIRDRDGLTYGTYARLKCREFGRETYWYAAATFGNALFAQGVAALQKEVRVFLEEGITEKRLAEKLVELYGRFAVLYADPRRAALPMLLGMLSTGSAHDTDIYLERLGRLSAEDVKQAAGRYLEPAVLAAAGAIDNAGNLLDK